jgi:hypothetical protein
MGPLVHFTCAAGDAEAIWKSKTLTPVNGREYDVELDIDPILRMGENAAVELGLMPALAMIGTQVQIVAIVEQVDDDGMVYLRLSPDCIVMIESAGPKIQCGQALRLVREPMALQVTPFGQSPSV